MIDLKKGSAKRILAVILLFVFSFTFVSCNNNKTDQSQSDTAAQSSEQTASVDPEGYKSIECRNAPMTSWRKVSFSHEGSETPITIPLPEDWDLTKSDGSYTVSVNGSEIGKITDSFPSDINSRNKFYKESSKNGNLSVEASSYIAPGSKEGYRNAFVMSYTENTSYYRLYIEVDYSALSKPAIYKMMTDAYARTVVVRKAPELKDLNSSRKIIAIGNSFLWTSDINLFLRAFSDTTSSGYDFVDRAVGYGSICRSINNDELMLSLAEGEYCMVLLCGIYSQEDVNAIQKMIDACSVSNTKLVLFPAHNEVGSLITSALTTYPELPIIDWKGEIDALIANGTATKLEMCIDDEHQHSTPLAGYVGARLVFNTLFGKAPEHINTQSQWMDKGINVVEIESKLKNYIKNGLNSPEETVNIEKYGF